MRLGSYRIMNVFAGLLSVLLVAANATAGGPSGTPGVWQAVTVPALVSGDWIQSIMADPVNPGVFYAAAGNNDGRAIKWLRSTDFGDTWQVRNSTAMNGNPWGFSIDPNPNRAPGTLPTLYSPAGYGSFGAWKSTDGAQTWTRLAGADVAFGPYNPFGATLTDLYHLQVLPDDPPNHVLATYHYGFLNRSDGGFGETWDGGVTWVVHPPPNGIGTSHYVMPISGTTWCVIAQSNNGEDGIWRTTTAGRVGGTAAAGFRDGTISTAAWAKVSNVEHPHGSFQAWKTDNGVWYAPGWTEIAKSTNQGATWTSIATGNWAGTFFGVRSSNIVGTATHLYSNYFLESTQARASRNDDTDWSITYSSPPANARGGNPYGTAVAYDAAGGHYVILMGDNTAGTVWRYIEPASNEPIIAIFANEFEG